MRGEPRKHFTLYCILYSYWTPSSHKSAPSHLSQKPIEEEYSHGFDCSSSSDNNPYIITDKSHRDLPTNTGNRSAKKLGASRHQSEPCLYDHHQKPRWIRALDVNVHPTALTNYYNTEHQVQLQSSQSLQSLCSTCKCVADQEQIVRWSSLPVLDYDSLWDSSTTVHYENCTTIKGKSEHTHVGESQVSICSNCRKLESMKSSELDINDNSCALLESLPVQSSSGDSDTTLQLDAISCTGIDQILTSSCKVRDRPAQLKLNTTDEHTHEYQESRGSSDSGMASTTSDGPRFTFDTNALLDRGYLALIGDHEPQTA